jgi:hypothetical protein
MQVPNPVAIPVADNDNQGVIFPDENHEAGFA